MSIVERINKINSLISTENKTDQIDSSIIDKYNTFNEWLISNGAIIPNIEFPILYSSLQIIGCRTGIKIGTNTAMLYIPYKMIIDSHNLEIKAKSHSLKLTLFLLEEGKKDNSFYRPYIDLICLEDKCPFIVNCYESYKEQLNNEIISEINQYEEEINEMYSKAKEIGYEYKFDLFKKFYIFVISREFYINEQSSMLIPLADFLNHNANVDIKYEFFDSENYVMKFTSMLDESHKDSNLRFYTNTESFFDNAKQISINDSNKDKELMIDLDIDENKPYEKNPSKNDYFVISTNSEQIFQKGEQIYNNYGKNDNMFYLIHFGFCYLGNKNDTTKVQITIPISKDDIELTSYLNMTFEKDIIDINDKAVTLLFYIQNSKFHINLFKLYKKIYFKDDAKTKKIGILKVIDELISFIDMAISKNSIDIEGTFTQIEENIRKGNYIETMLDTYKLSQQLNLFNQKELYSSLKDLIKLSSKTIKSTLITTLNNNKDKFISHYMTNETIIHSLNSFLNKNVI